MAKTGTLKDACKGVEGQSIPAGGFTQEIPQGYGQSQFNQQVPQMNSMGNLIAHQQGGFGGQQGGFPGQQQSGGMQGQMQGQQQFGGFQGNQGI